MLKWVLIGGAGVVALLLVTRRETVTSIFTSAPPILGGTTQGLPPMLCAVGSPITVRDSSAVGSPVMAGSATNCPDPYYGCVRATDGGTFCGDIV